MAGQQEVSGFSQSGSAEQECGTKSQSTRSSTAQDNLVVMQTRNLQTRNRVSVGPRPGRTRMARMDTLVPRPADENGRQLGLGVKVCGATGEACPGEHNQHGQESHGLHASAPGLALNWRKKGWRRKQ